jgi:ParB family chromosome partitioning protein
MKCWRTSSTFTGGFTRDWRRLIESTSRAIHVFDLKENYGKKENKHRRAGTANGGQVMTEIPFRILPIGDVVESPQNPRKHFDQGKLEELAKNMRDRAEEYGAAQAIITPLLARPQNGHFELAAGHRRRRAALLAGIEELPVVVREMSDSEFLEILTVENLQREDIHAIEEAGGYQELLRQPGYDAATVAAKIGKTEAYVYGRLHLLGIAPVVREAFLRDEITIGHAKLIAGLDVAQQAEALSACFEQNWRTKRADLTPVSSLKEWIQGNTGRNLAKAPFGLDDTELVPAAGACTACTKAPGVNPLLIDADGDKLCLDAGCYSRKLEAYIALKTKAGLVAISTSYQPKDVPAGVIIPREFTEIYDGPDEDDQYNVEQLQSEIAAATDEDQRKNLQEELKDLQSEIEAQKDCGHSEMAIVAHGHHGTGETKRICRDPKCPVHGRANATAADNSSQQARRKKEAEEAERKQKAALMARQRALKCILALDWIDGISRDLCAWLVFHFVQQEYSTDRLEAMAKEFTITVEKPDKGASRHDHFAKAILQGYELMSDATRCRLLIALLMGKFLDTGLHVNQSKDVLLLAARDNKLDLVKFESDAIREIKAAEKAEVEKKAAKDKPAAKKGSPKKSGKVKAEKQDDRKRAAAGDQDSDD